MPLAASLFLFAAQTSITALTVDQKVGILLQAWGKDVGHTASHDGTHEACKTILAFGGEAVPALVRAMQQSTGKSGIDAWVRDNAAWVLNLMGPEARAALPELIAMLKAKDPESRRWAAQILGNTGSYGREAVPALLPLLRQDSLTRGTAAFALGQIGTDPTVSVPAILKLLKDPDTEVRRLAIIALGRFGPAGQSAYARIVPMLQEPYARKSAAWALNEIAPENSAFVDLELRKISDLDDVHADQAFRDDPGLYCRAIPSADEIEQGMPLLIHLEAWARPEELPPWVKHINAFRIEEFLHLHLTNRETSQVLSLGIEEQEYPFSPDRGQKAIRLDGTVMSPWKATFRLVRLRGVLDPGPYHGTLELAYPRTKSKYWSDAKTQWENFGFWSGRTRSEPFPLRVTKQTAKMRTIMVPGQPHFEIGVNGRSRIVFKKEEFSSIQIQARNGFYVGHRGESLEGHSYTASGFPEWTAEERVCEIPERVQWPHYRLEVFETVNPPGHFWSPYDGSDGYKILWEIDFKTNLFSGFMK